MRFDDSPEEIEIALVKRDCQKLSGYGESYFLVVGGCIYNGEVNDSYGSAQKVCTQ